MRDVNHRFVAWLEQRSGAKVQLLSYYPQPMDIYNNVVRLVVNGKAILDAPVETPKLQLLERLKSGVSDTVLLSPESISKRSNHMLQL